MKSCVFILLGHCTLVVPFVPRNKFGIFHKNPWIRKTIASDEEFEHYDDTETDAELKDGRYFKDFSYQDKPTILNENITFLSEGLGPWLTDEVPHDGLQKWVAWCTMKQTNREDYLTRLKRRHQVQPDHDLWLRGMMLPSQKRQQNSEFGFPCKEKDRSDRERIAPRVLWEKCVISATTPSPDGMLICIAASTREQFEDFLNESPMLNKDNFQIFDHVEKYRWDQRNDPELRYISYESTHMFLHMFKETKSNNTKNQILMNQSFKDLKQKHDQYLVRCGTVALEGPLRKLPTKHTNNLNRRVSNHKKKKTTTSMETNNNVKKKKNNDDDEVIGSLIIQGSTDRNAAIDWCNKDPYQLAQLYKSSEIRRCMSIDITGLYVQARELEFRNKRPKKGEFGYVEPEIDKNGKILDDEDDELFDTDDDDDNLSESMDYFDYEDVKKWQTLKKDPQLQYFKERFQQQSQFGDHKVVTKPTRPQLIRQEQEKEFFKRMIEEARQRQQKQDEEAVQFQEGVDKDKFEEEDEEKENNEEEEGTWKKEEIIEDEDEDSN